MTLRASSFLPVLFAFGILVGLPALSPSVSAQSSSIEFAEVDAGLTDVTQGSSSVADVDGDGDQDLVITGQDANYDHTTILYENDGSGNFNPMGTGLKGVQWSATDFADIDVDGDPDLIVTGRDANGNETTTLYKNDGNGNFSPVSAGLTGVSFGSADFADIDGDGDPDLVITGFDGEDGVAILYENDGSGNFSPVGAGLTGVFSNSSSAFADVDGDEDPDLVITGQDNNYNQRATLYINDGNGNFSPASAGLTGVEEGSIDFADIDGDEDPDLLVTGGSGLTDRTTTLYINDGNGNFSPAGAGLVGVEFSSSDFADVDGDEDPDLVITGQDDNHNRTTILYKNDGNGNFSPVSVDLDDLAYGFSDFVDADGDGDPDLVVTGDDSNYDPQTIFYENRTNAPPVASDDHYTMSLSDLPVFEVEPPGVLRNDSDPDGDDLTASLVSGTKGLTFHSDGSFEYEVRHLFHRIRPFTPSPSVTFTYQVSDGRGGTDQATVTLTLSLGRPSPISSSEISILWAKAEGSSVQLQWRGPKVQGRTDLEVRRKGPEERTYAPAEASLRLHQEGPARPKMQAKTQEGSQVYEATVSELKPGIHQFEVRLLGSDGEVLASKKAEVTVQMEEALRLGAPAPNPVRREATFSFAVKEKSEARIVLYNVLGQMVRTLYEGTPAAGESQQVRLSTEGLPSGTYFLRLTAEGQTRTRRVTVVQ